MLTAEVRNHNGFPALFIDGKPNPGLMMVAHSIECPDYVVEFGKADVHLINLDLSMIYRPGTTDFDTAEIDRRVYNILDAQPDALLMPRIFVDSPPGWLQANPDHAITYQDGSKQVDADWPIGMQGTWASDAWKESASNELIRFIEYIESTDYGDRFFGYHLCSGFCGEWVHPSAYSGMYGDYSPSNTQAFVSWLLDKYGSLESVQTAWSDHKLSLDTISVPSAVRRRGTLSCVLRDPAKEMDVIDYYKFHADSAAGAINKFAEAAKSACDSKKLVCIFYGYQLGLSWHQDCALESGHFAFGKVLDCPYVDALTSPTEYSHRAYKSGVSVYPTLLDSVRNAGKLWIDENDVRTHLTPQVGWGWTKSTHETLQVQRRQLGTAIAARTGSWWFDMNGGWYSEPAVMDEIARLRVLARDMLNTTRESVAQVVYVVDEDSMAFSESNNNLSWSLLEAMNVELARMGAPARRILLRDFGKEPEDHRPKLYIFANLFAPTLGQIELIHKTLEADHATALWLYAPGYFQQNSIGMWETSAAAGISNITGMDIRQAQGHYEMSSRTIPGTLNALPETQYGSDRRTAPFFWVEDIHAEALAVSDDINRTMLARKQVGGWTSVYSACAPLPASVLREIARNAGVHIWWDGDGFMTCNASFICIHPRIAGLQSIRLPRLCKVTDIINGRLIEEYCSTFQVDLEAGQTGMYKLD